MREIPRPHVHAALISDHEDEDEEDEDAPPLPPDVPPGVEAGPAAAEGASSSDRRWAATREDRPGSGTPVVLLSEWRR